MMWWTDNHMSGWGWGAMTIGLVLFWGLLILGGVLLARALNRPSGARSGPGSHSPEQVLAHRFARGEIDEDEYHRRLAALSSAGFAAKP
jgi:putative membrane protein